MAADMDLELFRAAFARVSDAYGIETPGVPKAIRSPLTDELLRDHLVGKARVGAYTTDAEGLSDQIIIDIDIPKKKVDDLEEWERARLAAKSVLAVLRDLGAEGFITSSKSRGYHVRSLWEPSPAASLRKVGEFIARRAGVQAEVFPKQDKRTTNGLGNFVWLPLHGESLKDGKTAILTGDNGLDPMPDQWEALRDIRRNSLEALASAIAEMEEAEHSPKTEKTSTGTLLSPDLIGAVFERCPELDGLRRNAIEAGRLLPENKPGEHLARIRVMNLYRAFDGGPERAVQDIFSHLDDYDAHETEKQTASLHGSPPPCAELCTGGQCAAIKAIGKQSPIAFAYEERRESRKTEGPDKRQEIRPLFEDLSTLLSNPPRPQWLIHRLIETQATGLIFGASGAGKSFVAVDLAGSCATGEEWNGRRVASPGPVFYIAGEGKIGLLRRFQAWQLQRKVMIPKGRLFISTIRIELDKSGAKTAEMEIARIMGGIGAPPALIIIDTLARALPSGADENSAKDVGVFINIVDQIRDRFNCVVLIVHHSGHMEDKRARGSSALKAAMDIELCITKRNGERICEWTKLKDLPEEPKPQGFVLKRELIGAEEDGELISSAVVSWQGRAVANSTAKTTKTEKFGLSSLQTAITKGVKGGNFNFSSTVDAWRAEFYSGHWGDKDSAKEKAFYRVRESLVDKDLIVVRDGLYFLPDKTDKRTDADIGGHCPGAPADRHGHTPIGVSVCPALSEREDDVQYDLPEETT